MHARPALLRRSTAATTALLLALAMQVATTVTTNSPAAAAVAPVVQLPSTGVTADALPTVQIDGVVWSSTVIGNTVYAGGNFSHARPAGAGPGTSLTTRRNLLAFDITTGRLITSFAPSLNAQVKTVTRSPDRSRVYVGGTFTTANGKTRLRIAAYSNSTGALISAFHPSLNGAVDSITATNSVVYVGGTFSTANGVARSRLAAFSAKTGALLAWRPRADAEVHAVQLTPKLTRVIIGGRFSHVNGKPAYGLASVSAADGSLQTFAANTVVRDAGAGAAILSIRTDGSAMYATGYVYGKGGNFEGVLSADPNTGSIRWLADCHGDTYDTYSRGGVVFVASHEHYCGNIGGFPDTWPRTRWFRATAFTAAARGTVLPNLEPGYSDFRGRPSPALIAWTPDFAVGSFTGTSQAVWSLTGNAQYVVAGGEFPKVNGVAQQGLVRFAVPSLAPRRGGPRVAGPGLAPSPTVASSTSVRVGWQADWDRDDQSLTYTVLRDGVPVRTVTAVSRAWDRPVIGIVDSGLAPGSTHTYRITVADPNGNLAMGDPATITLPATDPPPRSSYADAVLAATPSHYWRLDGTGAATAGLDVDHGGYDPLRVGTAAQIGAAGAVVGDPDPAMTFDGTAASGAASLHSSLWPSAFTLSCWFSTTTAGGVLMSMGTRATDVSTRPDRQLALDATGHVAFSLKRAENIVIRSPQAYADGAYHHAVATLSGAGMRLYVDGALVASRTTTTMAMPLEGYWRVGGDDNLAGGADWFAGRLDEAATWSRALSASEVNEQFVASGR